MRALFLAVLLIVFGAPVFAEVPDLCPDIEREIPDDQIVIGTRFEPPFIQGDKRNPEGLAVALFELIARCINLDRANYQFIEFPTEAGLKLATVEGAVDIVIAPLALNADDEIGLDFTFPYFQSQLATLVAERTKSANFKRLIDRILQSNILSIIGGLLAFMIVVALYYWYFERKSGNEFFEGGPLSGLYRAIIWAALVVFQGRGEPFDLSSRGGQLIMLFLIFFGVTIISSFTAVITSSLTLQGLEPEVSTVADLQDKVVEGKDAEVWAEENFIKVRTTRSLPGAYWDLTTGKVDVFIHEKEVLQYHMLQGMDGVKFSQLTVAPVPLALALPEGSVLREDINRAILRILASPLWEDELKRYLGE